MRRNLIRRDPKLKKVATKCLVEQFLLIKKDYQKMVDERLHVLDRCGLKALKKFIKLQGDLEWNLFQKSELLRREVLRRNRNENISTAFTNDEVYVCKVCGKVFLKCLFQRRYSNKRKEFLDGCLEHESISHIDIFRHRCYNSKRDRGFERNGNRFGQYFKGEHI